MEIADFRQITHLSQPELPCIRLQIRQMPTSQTDSNPTFSNQGSADRPSKETNLNGSLADGALPDGPLITHLVSWEELESIQVLVADQNRPLPENHITDDLTRLGVELSQGNFLYWKCTVTL